MQESSEVLGPPQVEKVSGPPQVEVELRVLGPPQVALGSAPRAGGAMVAVSLTGHPAPLVSAALPSAWASPPSFSALCALERPSAAVALGLDPVVDAPPSPFVAPVLLWSPALSAPFPSVPAAFASVAFVVYL